jgi:hypothetical protein
LSYVPTWTDAVASYENSGLATGPRDTLRENRFKYAEKSILKRFDTTKCKFTYDGYEKDKTAILAHITSMVSLADLRFKVSKVQTCNIDYDDLGIVYFGMKKSQNSNKSHGKEESTDFSYKNIELVLKFYGRKFNKNKSSHILRILQAIGLIQKTRSYSAKAKKGQTWVVKSL